MGIEFPKYADIKYDMSMIRRNLSQSLIRRASEMPAVVVTGPRQSGKTTLCRSAFPEKSYVSFESIDQRTFATEDPRAFLEKYSDGAILDEIQYAPDLLSYMQQDLDDRPEPGRFILTGSQHFAMAQSISQSLAGRIAILNLLPPSLDELQRFPADTSNLWQTLLQGAYPRIHDRNLQPQEWLADYVTTYVQRDVRQVLNVTDLDAFTRFLQLAAGRTGCEINTASLGSDVGVNHKTIKAWLSVLTTSFLAFTLPAWHRNIRKQVTKSAKLHFFDSGLVCYLLGISEPEQLQRHPLRGAIFESWVASEIFKRRVHESKPARMFHFRDAKGFEVDLVIEEGMKVIAVEIKSGQTIATDFFKALARLRGMVAEGQPELSYEARLVYGGSDSQERSAATVIPWAGIQQSSWIP